MSSVDNARRRAATAPSPLATRLAPWLVALAGIALTLAAFWPGYLSWDSAYQWWQARGGELDPTHPPVMVHLWQVSRAVLPDPGGMLVLQATLWWSALALFANALGGSASRRAATVALLGVWPPLLAVLPHLWKDVWLAALFALAVALLAAELRSPRAPWRYAAFVALALGCAFRFNALPAALPLLAWVAWRSFEGTRDALWPTNPGVSASPRAAMSRRKGIVVSLLTVALTTLVVIAGSALNRAPGRNVPVWPSIALWDLAAVSIAEDRLLFPPEWVDPALTVADLRRDFVPYVNVPSFDRGQLRLNYYYDYTPAQFARLRDAWLALPVAHPRAYLAHRATLSAYLFGLHPHEHPDSLVISPAIVAFKDNPALAPPSGRLHDALQSTLSRLVDVPLFAAWPYLLLAFGLVGRWALRRDGGTGALSGIVALSSLMLAAPLLVLAPSSDFRYLLWSVAAALLAAALAIAPKANGKANGKATF